MQSYFIKNRFIAIEGIDGSGKSTLVRQMPEIITSLVGKSEAGLFHELFQPGTTEVGKRIRSILKDTSIDFIPAEVRHLLLSANRLDILLWIKKVKETGGVKDWFISDRHIDSTYVYQTEEGLCEDHIDLVACLYAKLPHPDLIIFLDVSPEEALTRLRVRGGDFDKYDSADIKIIQNRIIKYHKLISQRPYRYFVVDANKTPDEIKEYIINNLKLSF